MLIVCKDYEFERKPTCYDKDYKPKKESTYYNKVSDYKEIRMCYTMKKR